jgi:hypothetical protein
MSNSHIQAIEALAAGSAIRAYSWKNRGRSPLGYVQGMALAYARIYCKLAQNDPAALEMAKAQTADASRDALAHYAPEFQALGMSNSNAGADTLRHLFVLLIGLGMRESSGRHCEGRDMAAQNVQAETCETGLFQFSYNSRTASPLLPRLIQSYAGRRDFLSPFRRGVACDSDSWANHGTGPGAEFQQLAKQCPAFAVEYGAVLLRNRRRHFGPINTKKAELRREADALFQDVRAYVEANGVTAI